MAAMASGRPAAGERRMLWPAAQLAGNAGSPCSRLSYPFISLLLLFFFEQGSESDRILEARWARESGSTFGPNKKSGGGKKKL